MCEKLLNKIAQSYKTGKKYDNQIQLVFLLYFLLSIGDLKTNSFIMCFYEKKLIPAKSIDPGQQTDLSEDSAIFQTKWIL